MRLLSGSAKSLHCYQVVGIRRRHQVMNSFAAGNNQSQGGKAFYDAVEFFKLATNQTLALAG